MLGVGQEPTNHALRDIAALGSEFEKWGRKIVLLFPSEEQYKKFHPAEFQGLPSTIAYGVDIDNRIQNQIAKSMNLSNSDILPMFIIAGGLCISRIYYRTGRTTDENHSRVVEKCRIGR